MFSVATCRIKESADLILEGEVNIVVFSSHCLTWLIAAECVSEHGKQACESIGGECITERDGYYFVSIICVTAGVISLVFYIVPTARRLQGMCIWCHSSMTIMSNQSFVT